MISCPQWFENRITIQTVTPQEDTYCTVCHRLLLSFLLRMENNNKKRKELKRLLFKNSHRLGNTQNIPADRLPMPWLPSQGSDPSSQQVKEQMEKTTLMWLGSFPLNPKSTETHWLHQGLGWVGCSYSKSLVLTLRDSLVSSNWSPGPIPFPSLQHASATTSKQNVVFPGPMWQQKAETVQMAFPLTQEKILPNYFPPQELRLRVFNGLCRAGCAVPCVMLGMTRGSHHMLPGCCMQTQSSSLHY